MKLTEKTLRRTTTATWTSIKTKTQADENENAPLTIRPSQASTAWPKPKPASANGTSNPQSARAGKRNSPIGLVDQPLTGFDEGSVADGGPAHRIPQCSYIAIVDLPPDG